MLILCLVSLNEQGLEIYRKVGDLFRALLLFPCLWEDCL
jgi:hypothetical protein